MNSNESKNLEIEHKFLCKIPPIQISYSYKIVQTYLLSPSEDVERRVRKRTSFCGKTDFFYTEKKPVNDGLFIREETEMEISEEEYNKLLSEADPELFEIRKERTVFRFKGLKFEFDKYEFDDEYAILELELEDYDPEKIIELPSFIDIIKNVTKDKRFKNKSLAKTRCLPIDE